jgi:hypothetical protein
VRRFVIKQQTSEHARGCEQAREIFWSQMSTLQSNAIAIKIEATLRNFHLLILIFAIRYDDV